ncbi:hypothetical protein CLF_112722 [Clonorchis sinensis]|uniref:Uncharacterized protein n=1 Tax=Clonorchis sinensis TaxID=79923 RepID=G7YMP0_CLOSI|nr:hypothetical protein CLF_112722 [Clonorchis sinensis]
MVYARESPGTQLNLSFVVFPAGFQITFRHRIANKCDRLSFCECFLYADQDSIFGRRTPHTPRIADELSRGVPIADAETDSSSTWPLYDVKGNRAYQPCASKDELNMVPHEGIQIESKDVHYCVKISVARVSLLVADHMAVDLFTELGNWLGNVTIRGDIIRAQLGGYFLFACVKTFVESDKQKRRFDLDTLQDLLFGSHHVVFCLFELRIRLRIPRETQRCWRQAVIRRA